MVANITAVSYITIISAKSLLRVVLVGFPQILSKGVIVEASKAWWEAEAESLARQGPTSWFYYIPTGRP